MTQNQTEGNEMCNSWILARRAFLILSLIVIGSHQASADVVSLDSNYVPGQADVTTKLNNDRTALTNGVNNVRGVFAGIIQSSGQIKAATVGAENMAADASPINRTNEGASCPDLVVSGLLPVTSASLVGSIPAGIAYPDGYRIEKTSTTGKTFTASKWTYAYLLTSGSFSYQEVTIGATTPATPAGAAVLFRASTDSTTINTVTDLRKTSCAQGPFSAIANAQSEGTLDDMFSVGVDNRRFSPAGVTPEGWVRGLWVSLDSTTTQFIVTKGSAYINGKYRFTSQNVTVPSTADLPSDGISGIDSTPVVSDTTYCVYAVADQAESRNLSITYSSNCTAPAGVTNSRLIGRIGADSNIRFASANTVTTAHGYSDRETIGGWISFNGTGLIRINDAYNVSGIVDDGTGNYTVTWDQDFANANYAYSGGCFLSGANMSFYTQTGAGSAAGSLKVGCASSAGVFADPTQITAMAIGDMRR